MPRRPRTFYAAYRPYGLSALNRDGPRADILHAFARESDRAVWVAADREHREVLAATSRDIRAALTFEARHNYQVIETHETGDGQ